MPVALPWLDSTLTTWADCDWRPLLLQATRLLSGLRAATDGRARRRRSFPPRIAHGWSVVNSHEPRTVIVRKTATSKQQKSMNTPISTCPSRSARANRPAAATPKTRKTSPCTAVYFRTMSGAAPCGRRAQTSLEAHSPAGAPPHPHLSKACSPTRRPWGPCHSLRRFPVVEELPRAIGTKVAVVEYARNQPVPAGRHPAGCAARQRTVVSFSFFAFISFMSVPACLSLVSFQ
jgi:hypothetical protein